MHLNLLQTFFSILLTCLLNSASAETISFNIVIFGNTVGRMDVAHAQDKNGNDVYTIESKSKVKFLWILREGYSKFEAVFKNGKLVSSSHIEVENGKTKRSTIVKFNGKQYEVKSVELGISTFTEVPVCCDASIYFSDYKNIKRIFYLPDASFYNVTPAGTNTVEFKSGDGHRNVYIFENGKIKGMEFHLPLATVYMTKIT